MLAGILLPFCLKIIEMYSKNTSLIIAMTISYFLSKVFVPRYSILTTLTIGVFLPFTKEV
nr:benzoate/H(+) symporter BenE family transporter [Acinetobacter colistiniresistens]